MDLELKSRAKAFGGELRFYRHPSKVTGSDMSFGIFFPPREARMVMLFLSGLTCTEENFMIKAHALAMAAEEGVILVTPDTSPRGTDLPGEHESWDVGSGAGFYLDAQRSPWDQHYRMESYVTKELPSLLHQHWQLEPPFALSGHSMGGHGALTLGIKHPELFRSLSAFAPIVAPSQVPWGQKAFRWYLGEDEINWASHDACELVVARGYERSILIDQGDADTALQTQLKPELFQKACQKAGVELNFRLQRGYDHGYFFVSTFINDHLNFHLKAFI